MKATRAFLVCVVVGRVVYQDSAEELALLVKSDGLEPVGLLDAKRDKPDPAFFTAILEDLGLRPDQVGFIDDSEPNVSAARALGIATYHHPRGADASTLRAGVESLLASP